MASPHKETASQDYEDDERDYPPQPREEIRAGNHMPHLLSIFRRTEDGKGYIFEQTGKKIGGEEEAKRGQAFFMFEKERKEMGVKSLFVDFSSLYPCFVNDKDLTLIFLLFS